MKLTELKIKRKSLALEARCIRMEEQKALKAARAERAMNAHTLFDQDIKRLVKQGFSVGQIGRIKRKRNSKYEDHSVARMQLYYDLRRHRIFDLRKAARHSHLAHAYLKGMRYSDVENPMVTMPPDWAAVARDVRTFGGNLHADCKPSDIAVWYSVEKQKSVA